MQADAAVASTATNEAFLPTYSPKTPLRTRRSVVRPPELVCVPRSRVELLNRVMNIVLAIVALVVLAPVLLVIAIAVRLSSPGPVLYTQQRVGVNRRRRATQALYDRRGADVGGIVFTIYKFRTMRSDAEGSSGAVWATQNDPRVTRLGRVL